jgi:hypothetical protein
MREYITSHKKGQYFLNISSHPLLEEDVFGFVIRRILLVNRSHPIFRLLIIWNVVFTHYV